MDIALVYIVLGLLKGGFVYYSVTFTVGKVRISNNDRHFSCTEKMDAAIIQYQFK